MAISRPAQEHIRETVQLRVRSLLRVNERIQLIVERVISFLLTLPTFLLLLPAFSLLLPAFSLAFPVFSNKLDAGCDQLRGRSKLLIDSGNRLVVFHQPFFMA